MRDEAEIREMLKHYTRQKNNLVLEENNDVAMTMIESTIGTLQWVLGERE